MKTDSNFYVYAYFDPRNYHMFYVGKGKGSRKNAGRADKAGTPRERQIREIERAGQKHLVKIVAANLTEAQAFLVEKALIWGSDGWLTNISGGNYSENFRPPNTLHLDLPGFDTARGVFFVNVDANNTQRQWEDYRKYEFLAAGYGRKYSSQLDRLEVGSIAAAYQKGFGYVGIARVIAKPVPVKDFRHHGRPLKKSMLYKRGPEPNLLHHANNLEKCEYLVGVKWIKSVPMKDAHFQKKSGLYAKQQVVASLSNQLKTQEYLQEKFKVNFKRLLAAD